LNDRVLVIEDEPEIGALIGLHLERAGYQVSRCADGQEALERVFASPPDAIVLDLMLPGMSGLELLREIRGEAITADLPVVVVSARGAEMDRLLGFERGADDYIVKPFSPRELVARLEAILRRAHPGRGRPTIEVGPLKIDTPGREAWWDGARLDLTPREFDLLTYLARRAGRVVSRDELLRKVWAHDGLDATRTVDVHIRRLRAKLGAGAAWIETAIGAGYKLVARPPG
jgi:DNA-binding response OmpR family regulator